MSPFAIGAGDLLGKTGVPGDLVLGDGTGGTGYGSWAGGVLADLLWGTGDSGSGGDASLGGFDVWAVACADDGTGGKGSDTFLWVGMGGSGSAGLLGKGGAGSEGRGSGGLFGNGGAGVS